MLLKYGIFHYIILSSTWVDRRLEERFCIIISCGSTLRIDYSILHSSMINRSIEIQIIITLLTCLRFPLSIISKSCKKKRAKSTGKRTWPMIRQNRNALTYLSCLFALYFFDGNNTCVQPLVENVLVMQIYRMPQSYRYFWQLWILQSIWQKCWCYIFFPFFFQFYNKLKFFINF